MRSYKWVLPLVGLLSGIVFLAGCSTSLTPLKVEEDCPSSDCGIIGLNNGDNVKIELNSGGSVNGRVDDCSCKTLTVEQIGNYGRVQHKINFEEISQIYRIGEGSWWTIAIGSVVVLRVLLGYLGSNYSD